LAVGGAGGDPRRHGAGFVDAFLQNLPLLVLLVEHELVGVLRLVQLPARRIDADLPEHAFHAEGAGLVGDDGHDERPMVLSRASWVRMRTKAMVVDMSRSPVSCNRASKVASGGHRQRFGGAAALRQIAAQRGAAFLQILISGLSSAGL
jgi:hypothetical protein